MALAAAAEEYFRSMNPLAAKIQDDLNEAKRPYQNNWQSLTAKEKVEIINESLIKPDIALKYALIDNLDFDINNPPVYSNDLMLLFGQNHGQRLIQDENTSYKDEHSAPFLYQTKSQLNLCVLSDSRGSKEEPTANISELVLSHSKVVSELKNALKSNRTFKEEREEPSPGFISKFIGNFKSKDEERECLVSGGQTQIVASSDNFFRTNFKSPHADTNFEKDYRSSVVKSSSDVSEENRGLLSSSQASSADFHSTETLTDSILPKSGYDFLDNW